MKLSVHLEEDFRTNKRVLAAHAGKFIVRRGHPIVAHPFFGGWHPNRLDMGYDGTFAGSLFAPFKGRVVYSGPFNGWNGSWGLVIESAHPHNHSILWGVPTNRLYFTEGIRSNHRTGDHFRCGEKIGYAVDSPYGNSYGYGAKGAIEFGVAAVAPDGVQPNTYAIELGLGSNAARNMVLRFAKWCEWELHMAPPITTVDAGRA